jgi:hypothetical protein
MVFSAHEGVSNGKLIDFDFGGRTSKRRYPQGYLADLPDGGRVGQEMQYIQEYDEWYALAYCMFSCHQFACDQANFSDEANLRLFSLSRKIHEDLTKNVQGLAQYVHDITAFLNGFQHLEWGCTLSQRFQAAISNMRAGNFKHATGSPCPQDNGSLA